MKILGIDYGDKKVGLSLSTGNLAMPWQTLLNHGVKELIQELGKIVDTEDISKIVVGMPLGLKGNKTDQSREVERFYQALHDKLKVPVDLADERFSTQLAIRQGSADDDAQAAANILQSYLDSKD